MKAIHGHAVKSVLDVAEEAVGLCLLLLILKGAERRCVYWLLYGADEISFGHPTVACCIFGPQRSFIQQPLLQIYLLLFFEIRRSVQEVKELINCELF